MGGQAELLTEQLSDHHQKVLAIWKRATLLVLRGAHLHSIKLPGSMLCCYFTLGTSQTGEL